MKIYVVMAYEDYYDCGEDGCYCATPMYPCIAFSTEEEARTYCKDPKTAGDDWLDIELKPTTNEVSSE
jgi:hypothetical protein